MKKYLCFEYMDEKYWDSYEHDNNGLPMVNYGSDIGMQYNPVTIEQYALVMYNLYIVDNENYYLQAFFSAVDWLVDNIELNSNGVTGIPYKFDLTRYALYSTMVFRNGNRTINFGYVKGVLFNRKLSLFKCCFKMLSFVQS